MIYSPDAKSKSEFIDLISNKVQTKCQVELVCFPGVEVANFVGEN